MVPATVELRIGGADGCGSSIIEYRSSTKALSLCDLVINI